MGARTVCSHPGDDANIGYAVGGAFDFALDLNTDPRAGTIDVLQAGRRSTPWPVSLGPTDRRGLHSLGVPDAISERRQQ